LRGTYSLDKRVSTLVSQVFVLQMRFRLCGRHFCTVDAISLIGGRFRSVNAFSPLRRTSSLSKPFMTLKVRRFGSVYAFSLLRVMVSLGKSVFALASDGFVL